MSERESRPRRFAGDTLVIATHNPGKVREIAQLLAGRVRQFPGAADLSLPEPEETETTFAGNAALKALAVARATGLPALADDSGLAVRALGGDPGVYSARWAGPAKDFPSAMRRVCAALDGKPDRSASFHCVLALAWPDGHVELAQGSVDGTIAAEPQGTGGFGYDPIFVPRGYGTTFGVLSSDIKTRLSHRSAALATLIARCFTPADGEHAPGHAAGESAD